MSDHQLSEQSTARYRRDGYLLVEGLARGFGASRLG